MSPVLGPRGEQVHASVTASARQCAVGVQSRWRRRACQHQSQSVNLDTILRSVHRIHSFHLSVFLPSCPRPSPPLLVLSSRLVRNSQGRVIRSLTCVQTRQLPGRKYSNVPVCTGSFDRTVASPIPSPAPTMTFAPTLAPTMAHPTLVRTHALMHARTRARWFV